ncbi:MAG: hypothetical protein OHK0026_11590 [Rhodocyclaceae bacterium]
MSRQINLYNRALRAKREFITGYTLILGLAVIVLGLALTYGYYQFRLGQMAREAARVEQDLKQQRDELARLSEEAARVRRSPKIAAELAALEARLKAHEEVARALDAGVLGSASGFSELLRALARQSLDGLWLTGLSIGAAGTQLTIEGRTLDPELVAEYIRRLGAEASMRGRGFDALHIAPPEPAAQRTAQPADETPAQPRHIAFVLRAGGDAKADSAPQGEARR